MKDRCETCIFYRFFDSGYGYCKRYPPKEVEKYTKQYLGLLGWRKVKHVAIESQLTPWDEYCGEFKSKVVNE
jgi:hypothetical protein